MADWLVHNELEKQSHWRHDALAAWYEGTEYTYGDLNSRVNRLARALREAGVEPGDSISVHAKNHVDVYTVFYACSKLGAIFSPISTFQSEANVQYICDTLEPEFVFFTDDEDIVEDTLVGVRAAAPYSEFVCLDDGSDGDEATIGSLLDGREASNPEWADSHSRETYLDIFWTSGTTGRPKPVTRDHLSSLHFADPLKEAIPFDENSRRLVASNMMFVAAHLQYGIPTVAAGGSFFITREIDSESIYEIVTEFDANVTLMSFTQTQLLFEYLEENDLSLEFDYFYGAIHSADGARKRLDITKELVHLYATTEVGVPLATKIEPPFGDPPTIGKPGQNVDIRLVDPDDTSDRPEGPVHPGDVGEIAVKGDVAMTRYLTEDDQREKVHDGWVSPGDVLRVNDDGELEFVGRADNRLRSGGVNVYPEEVEAVVSDHPDVNKVVVVGVDDETWGDRISALVVTKRTDLDAFEGELDEFCKASGKLTRELRPRAYAFIDTSEKIPTGAQSKVDRRGVEDQFFG